MKKSLRKTGEIVLAIIIIIVVTIKSTEYYLNIKIKDNIVLLENELYYWETKALLIKEIEQYMKLKVPVNNVSPILVLKYADKYNINPKLFLVQGLLESHYGTKGLARKTHSVCNVGAWDDGTITCRYNHPNESIEPYFKLIKKMYLVDKTEEDLLKNFVDKNGNKYASYPYYEQELKFYWDELSKITKLDSLLEIHNYYKIELGR